MNKGRGTIKKGKLIMYDNLNVCADAPAPAGQTSLSRERLLGVADVCAITGLGKVTASKLMKESGRCFQLHRRLYVLEASLFRYFHEREEADPCSL